MYQGSGILEGSGRPKASSRGRRGVLVCGKVAVPDLSTWEPGTGLSSVFCPGTAISNASFHF